MFIKKHNKEKSFLIALFLFFTIFVAGFASEKEKVYAATGSLFDPVEIEFGENYTTSWSRTSDHLKTYNEIEVPQKGILTIEAMKPYDSEGEMGRIEFTLYDEEDEVVWGNNSTESVNSSSQKYKLNVGLKAGTYTLVMEPGFSVSSGIISTSYSIDFKTTELTEIEPNEGMSTASLIKVGKGSYTGYFGAEYFDDACENDYYKVYLTKGKSYKIALSNYEKIDPTTILIDFYNPSGTEISWNIAAKYDSATGMRYNEYEPKSTGYHYICLYNYHGKQIKYELKVSEIVKKAQTIKGVSNFNKRTTSDDFNLKASAKGKITYSNSNKNVCSVYSDGEIYLTGKPGKATITIKAAATPYYKAATKKVTIVVKPPKVSLRTLTNLKTNKLKVRWNNNYDVEGYQVCIATNKKFTLNKKVKNIYDCYDNEFTFSKLKKGKTYYVQIRGFDYCANGTKSYSEWSTIKSIKIKK